MLVLLDWCVLVCDVDLFMYVLVICCYVGKDMIVCDLCWVMIIISDNIVVNLLFGVVGGLFVVIVFLCVSGDVVSCSDWLELELNSFVEGDLCDIIMLVVMVMIL